ncbi:MAG: MFS transporter [Deltaproteobacteria bacterium]|nr:MFS transporter [Deltaproteobacteria bacterium]MBW2053785.1 MFS transporter [Deltaproteobacteria bacterium]MBW2142434.1 MFS transporter [Deltaproteobacteria bacterium]MBW2324532.1 MFS transporter [Deltaproteobacteria bacterium]
MNKENEHAIADPRLSFGDGSSHPKMRFAAFASLKNRDFRWYWFGMLASFNAMQMQVVARGWLVYTMTNSPLALGLVSAGFGIPMLLFSLYGGAIADRVEKRNLLLVTRSGMSLVSLIVTILITTKMIALWHLMLASVLSGAFMSFYMPARQAFVMELVGKKTLLNAIAMNSMALNICRIASPALAGVLIKVIGIPGVYWLITISSGLVVFTIWMIPRGKPMSVRANVPLLSDVVDGLRYVRSNSIILALLLIGIVPILTAMPYQLLMPVFAKTVFKAGETGFGLLMSAVGVGALTGSTLIASLGNFQHKGMLSFAVGIVFGICLILFSLSGSLLLAAVFLIFVGGGSSMYMTLNSTLIMSNTPETLIGRVMSINMMTFGLMPLAMLPAGALAEIIGAPYTVCAGGVLLTLFLALVTVFQPRVWRLK